MKFRVLVVLFVLLACLIPDVADARLFDGIRGNGLFGRRTRYYRTNYVAFDYGDATTDQEMCEKEAAYQAANYAYYHVGVNIGNFEGWGCGWSPDCDTCRPGYGMTLTGDAAVQAPNGMWFRVRSWR